MGVTFKRIISCLVVVCLTAAILTGLTSLTEKKSSLEKYTQFFEQDADFDVLFLGSSKVINGIMPMELWNDFGIVSYNFGGHSNSIPTSYWVLRNALDYTTPKLVVLDCFGSNTNSLIHENFYYSHLSFDAFPISATKIQAALDLITPERVADFQAKRMEMLWNFSIYHSRWNELTENDFRPKFTYQKGAEFRSNVSIPAEMATVSPDLKNTQEKNGIQYLIKTIELCRERGIDILLVSLPFPASEQTLIASNTVADVAKQYNVEYLNYFDMDIVDFRTDMYDRSSHLNPSGARKVTDHLGHILTQRYGIPDQRNNPDYQVWYQDAVEYQKEKVALFDNAASAWCYWMLLADDDFSFVAELSESDLQQDAVLTALLRNAGIQPEKVKGRCIIAADRHSGKISYTEYDALLRSPAETALGSLHFEEGRLMLNGQECWSIHDSESTAMRFALFDHTITLLGNAWFSAGEIPSASIS